MSVFVLRHRLSGLHLLGLRLQGQPDFFYKTWSAYPAMTAILAASLLSCLFRVGQFLQWNPNRLR